MPHRQGGNMKSKKALRRLGYILASLLIAFVIGYLIFTWGNLPK